MIRCPADGSLLYRRVVGGVTLDGCPFCGGAWFDKGELQNLSRDPQGLRMIDDAFPPGVERTSGARTGQCPRCGEALHAFEYQTLRGVRLERCKACDGVWLAHGQPSELSAKLAASPDAALLEPSANPSPAVAARFGPARSPAAVAALPAQDIARPAVTVADATATASLPLVRGRVVGNFDRSPGFFGSVSRGMRFIQGAYQLALDCPRLLLPMALGAAAVLVLVGGLIATVLVLGAAVQPGTGGEVPVGGLVLAGAFAGIGLVAAGANMVILGMTVSMVDAYLKGLEPSLGTAWRDVTKNAGAVLAMAVVTAVVNAITSGRDGRRGFLGGLVDAAWKVLACLLMPIIMIEDVGFGAALRRAREIHGRGLLQIAVGEVGLRAIAGLSGFAILAVLGLLGVLLVPTAGLPGLIGLGVVATLLLVALGVLNAFARGAYYTCLYLWAVEVERVGEPSRALVPAPLATALVG